MYKKFFASDVTNHITQWGTTMTEMKIYIIDWNEYGNDDNNAAPGS